MHVQRKFKELQRRRTSNAENTVRAVNADEAGDDKAEDVRSNPHLQFTHGGKPRLSCIRFPEWKLRTCLFYAVEIPRTCLESALLSRLVFPAGEHVAVLPSTTPAPAGGVRRGDEAQQGPSGWGSPFSLGYPGASASYRI